MKKFVLSLIVMLCASLGASAQKVYIAPSKSAIAYHKSKDCSYLRNSKNVTDISTSEAKEMGRHPCVRCYPAQAEATKKAIAKEQAEKKATQKCMLPLAVPSITRRRVVRLWLRVRM